MAENEEETKLDGKLLISLLAHLLPNIAISSV